MCSSSFASVGSRKLHMSRDHERTHHCDFCSKSFYTEASKAKHELAHKKDSTSSDADLGSSYWVCGPKQLDADELAQNALQEGIIIEPGRICFARSGAPKNYFRLAFSSIETDKVEPGIKLLSSVIAQQIGQ